MKKTDTFNLNLPENNDFYDVEDFNENFKFIDTGLDAFENTLNSKAGTAQATSSADGLMSKNDKSKLDGIETNAQKNTVLSVAGKVGAVTLEKSDVGLGNVDNTSDANKPVSTATQTALNGKAASSHSHTVGDLPTGTTSSTVCIGNDSRLSDSRTPTSHSHAAGDVTSGSFAIARIPTGTTSSTVCIGNDSRLSDSRTPTSHSHTKSDVGLGNVDNTSDANKPVSTATQTALNGKAASSHSHTVGDLPTGTTSSTVCIGNDSRLSDSRTPTSHSHAAGDVTSGSFAIARIPTGTTSSTVCIGNDSRLSDSRTPNSHSQGASTITAGTFPTGAFTFSGSQVNIGNSSNYAMYNSSGDDAGLYFYSTSKVTLRSSGDDISLRPSTGYVRRRDGNLRIVGGSATSASNDNNLIAIGAFSSDESGAWCHGWYNNTTTSSANMNIQSGGLPRRVSSSRKYKKDIRDVEPRELKEFVMGLKARTWVDSGQHERTVTATGYDVAQLDKEDKRLTKEIAELNAEIDNINAVLAEVDNDDDRVIYAELLNDCQEKLDATVGLQEINQQKIDDFNWYNENNWGVDTLPRIPGYVAEEVAEISPLSELFISYDEDGDIGGFAYDRLIIAAMSAVQQQENDIKLLTERVEKLEELLMKTKEEV